ncbi:MAG: DinB family protein [Chitinophagales bacterium]
MKRSAILTIPEYFEHFINLIDDIELDDAFEKSIQQIDSIDISLFEKIGLQTYAEGKWTVNKIIQHITDWERIYCYRILLYVRHEGTIPPGHDEQKMADASNADAIPITQLINELRSVRIASRALFQSFNDEQFMLSCKFLNYEMSVLALGFNIIGHQIHHLQVIQERYVPLIH